MFQSHQLVRIYYIISVMFRRCIVKVRFYGFVIRVCTSWIVHLTKIDHFYWWMLYNFYDCDTVSDTRRIFPIITTITIQIPTTILICIRRCSFQVWGEVSSRSVGTSRIKRTAESTMYNWMEIMARWTVICKKWTELSFESQESFCNSETLCETLGRKIKNNNKITV